jgi:hypothetical protein
MYVEIKKIKVNLIIKSINSSFTLGIKEVGVHRPSTLLAPALSPHRAASPSPSFEGDCLGRVAHHHRTLMGKLTYPRARSSTGELATSWQGRRGQRGEGDRREEGSTPTGRPLWR